MDSKNLLKDPNTNWKYVLVVLFLTLLVGGGILGYQYWWLPQQQVELPEMEKPEREEEEEQIPEDWIIKTSKICNVSIPIPPKKAPYYYPPDPDRPGEEGAGRFWQFEEYEAGMFLFKTTARAIYRNLEEGSGFVSGDVEVICSSNDAGYTTESLILALESQLSEDYPSLAITSKKEGTMWGRKLVVVKFLQGGMFGDDEHYIFATSKSIYLVRKISMSESQFVRDVTDRIFKGLSFVE